MSQDFLEPLPARSRPSISLSGGAIGLIIGIMVGLFYAWQIDPVVVTNITPADLHAADKRMYVVSAVQEYAASRDLEQAVIRILEVEPAQNPFQVAADTACALIRSGEVDDLGDIEVIRNLRALYEPQGIQAGCDTNAFNTPVPVTLVQPSPTITFTPSITPVASKTSTQAIDPVPLQTLSPNNTAQAIEGGFRQAFVEAFCNPNISGVIEIYVRDVSGVGIAGLAVQVTDNDRQQSVFYTGLKPERGDDYADFEMTAGKRYRVAILDQGQPSQEIEATPCDGDGTLTSYRVVIQQQQAEN